MSTLPKWIKEFDQYGNNNKLKEALTIAMEALESVGGFDCVNSDKYLEIGSCGYCFSCEPRKAMQRIAALGGDVSEANKLGGTEE